MNQKKVKAVIFLCLVVIVLLLTFSVILTVKISSAKKELENQNSKITELEEIIENYKNLPSGDNSEIIQN